MIRRRLCCHRSSCHRPWARATHAPASVGASQNMPPSLGQRSLGRTGSTMSTKVRVVAHLESHVTSYCPMLLSTGLGRARPRSPSRLGCLGPRSPSAASALGRLWPRLATLGCPRLASYHLPHIHPLRWCHHCQGFLLGQCAAQVGQLFNVLRGIHISGSGEVPAMRIGSRFVPTAIRGTVRGSAGLRALDHVRPTEEPRPA